MNFRLYYFYRDNDVVPPSSDHEAFTIGGSLAYQSGWLANIFRLGLEGFVSQKKHTKQSKKEPKKKGGHLGIEPRTSWIQTKNHTPRTMAQLCEKES